MKAIPLFLIPFLFCFSVSNGQISKDSIVSDSLPVFKSPDLKFNYKQLIIPAALITYGIIGIESDAIKNWNSELKEEVTENIDKKISVDDFSQYAPAAAVYALNLTGIQGKHKLKDRSIILATSYMIMAGTVFSLKSITHIQRPDGSNDNSFPSGHTATAFAGAEFLWQEYRDVSIWYGITGYVVAAGTGFFRMYNDKHWFTDVVAGAGIGILSTKAAYWLYPYLNKKLFKSHTESKVMISPFYNGDQGGLGLLYHFK